MNSSVAPLTPKKSFRFTAQEIQARIPKRERRNIPGIPGLRKWEWLPYTLGCLYDWPKTVDKARQKYGLTYKAQFLHVPHVALLGADANEFVLKDTEQLFSSRKAWDPILDKSFTGGIIAQDFDEHRIQRKILQQGFKRPVMESYVEHMNYLFAKDIKKNCTEGKMKFFDYIKPLFLINSASLFYGVELSEQEKRNLNKWFNEALAGVSALNQIPVPGTTIWRAERAQKFLEAFTYKHIEGKKRVKTNDFFSQFCHAHEEGVALTDEQIVHHLVFLLFAAHDTTTSTLCSIMYYLAKHPEWQDRIIAEIDQHGEEAVLFEDMSKMRAMELVFLEAQRLHPPLPGITRRSVAEFEFRGYKIPENTAVGIHPAYVHRMEEYWTNPNQFDPERFSPERAEHKGHFYQYIPFGGGAHKCLGLNFGQNQAKIFLYQFFKDYRIKIRKGQPYNYRWIAIGLPTDGLPIEVLKR